MTFDVTQDDGDRRPSVECIGSTPGTYLFACPDPDCETTGSLSKHTVHDLIEQKHSVYCPDCLTSFTLEDPRDQ